MNRDIRINKVRSIVDSINQANGEPILILAGIESQWARGNGSIKRADVDVATLSLNIKDTCYLVGCDGVKRGINSFLDSKFELNNKNSQNTRYKCPDTQIADVIAHYASLKV